jgi:hypothetical protein
MNICIYIHRGSTTSLRSASSESKASEGGVTTYVVERCENEFLNEYKEVLRTSSGQGVVHRLLPGTSYRFRCVTCWFSYRWALL